MYLIIDGLLFKPTPLTYKDWGEGERYRGQKIKGSQWRFKMHMFGNITKGSIRFSSKTLKSSADNKLLELPLNTSFSISSEQIPSIWKIYFIWYFLITCVMVSIDWLKTPKFNLQESSYFLLSTVTIKWSLSRILIRLIKLLCTASEALTIFEITNKGIEMNFLA